MDSANPTQSWPNLFIVGAAKAGTTALSSFLDSHPSIYMSAVKEPHFFSDVGVDTSPHNRAPRIADASRYLDLFRGHNDAAYRGEASPSYLWDPASARRIRSTIPRARIIILVRDPVARIKSHYLMDVREGNQTRNFLAAIAQDRRVVPREWSTTCHLYVDLGLYHDQIKRYYDEFGPDQVLVLESSKLRHDIASVRADLGNFLGIDADDFTESRPDTLNAMAQPRSRVTARVSQSRASRVVARRMLPRSIRHWARDSLLRKPASLPTLTTNEQMQLQGLFEHDIRATRDLVGRPLASLTENWVGNGRSDRTS